MAYEPKANKTVDNIQYDETQLSGEGDVVEIRDVWMPKAQSWSPVYTHLTSPFSFDHFTSPRLPVDLGPFDIDFVKEVPRILRLTIKPVGEINAYIPEELKEAETFITQILEYERMINPNFENCEIHITTDYGFVKADETQRFPGWHVDGLQGGKFKNKLLAEHSYIASTSNPTEFCLQPFFIKHYDEDITNFFKAFDQQARDVNIYRGIPKHLYLMDAYMVHRTPTIREDTYRGFVRITVANAPLPIEFNTLNPMLNQERPVFKLDIRDWLRAPDHGINYDYYGLDGKLGETTEDVKPVEVIQEERSKAVQDIGKFDNKPLTVGKTIIAPERWYPKVQPLSPTYRDMVEEFEPKKYTNPRLPIDLGVADVNAIQSVPNTLRMPLKWWDSEEINIPDELLPIKGLLERIFTYDKCHNPLYNSQVAHITHDTRIIEEGKTHRFPGFHGDDLQGGAFPEKEIIAHSYILTTNPGTEFCLQPFFVGHVDDSHERHFTEFDKQASEENIYTVKSGHIYLMDPYAVHRTPLHTIPGPRTFLRVTFSTKNMLLPHNTFNPMFEDKQEEYDALPVPHLNETRWTQASDKHVPYKMYGISR
jgi:hypothetical protein